MGYLNKETVTVDAILTKRGRELLSQGRSAFQITQFAVADDEIDYGLYNPAHPLGTEYYGSAIENMPVVEASPDDAQNLRYKLVTLDRSVITQVNVIPTINLDITSLVLTFGQQSTTTITPGTISGAQASQLDGANFGYTAILYDASAALIEVVTPIAGAQTVVPQAGDNIQVARGVSFKITPKDVSTITRTVVVFTGNQSGATISVPVTINPQTVV